MGVYAVMVLIDNMFEIELAKKSRAVKERAS